MAWVAVDAAPRAGVGRAEEAGAWTRRLRLQHGAFDHRDVPSAMVHAPAGFVGGRPFELVVFLHGHMGCAPVLMLPGPVRCRPGHAPIEGWDLAGAHDRGARHSLFVIPQLRLMRRSGAPGRFAVAGGFARFVQELLSDAQLPRLGPGASSRLEQITLVAHSGGYRAALAILERGGLARQVRNLVLLDALYDGEGRVAAWLRQAPERRLVSLDTGHGTPAARNRKLRRLLQREGLAARSAQAGQTGRWRYWIARVSTPHARVAREHLAPVLAQLSRGSDGTHE